MMHRFLFISFTIVCLWLMPAGAAAATADNSAIPELGEYHRDAYRGYSVRIDSVSGDTMLVLHLANITVYPPERFASRSDEEYYWRTVRDVKLTLPYAKLIAETLIETYEYIETFGTEQERTQYLKDMESSLFEQYKPVLRRFSKRQAKTLIKLIQRETHQTSYDIVRAFLGSFRATFWQGFGRLFGVNLKAEFRPAEDADDAMLNRIASRVEEGTL